jgi:hypothetical protein
MATSTDAATTIRKVSSEITRISSHKARPRQAAHFYRVRRWWTSAY